MAIKGSVYGTLTADENPGQNTSSPGRNSRFACLSIASAPATCFRGSGFIRELFMAEATPADVTANGKTPFNEPLQEGTCMPGVTPVDETVARLAAEIDRHGFAVLENYLSPDALEQGRAFVSQQAQQHQGEYFAIHGIEALSGNLPANLALSAPLREMLSDLYKVQTGREPSAEEQVFPVIRCLQGKSGLRQSHFFDILPGLSLRSQQAGRPGIPTALGGFRRVVASVGSCC